MKNNGTKIKISNKWIGNNYPTFVVAEAGINHNGSLRVAKKMISKAKEVGVDAVKFQTFKAIDLASLDSKFFRIFKKVELDYADFGELSDYAKSEGIIFFSTPFSEEAVDVLSRLDVPAFKIASGDITHIPLIKYVASKKKPVILSTGMSELNEIRTALQAIKSKGNNNIAIMHSVSAYPTPPLDANLRAITTLQNSFRYPIGYSDNGGGILVPIVAVALGAQIIEKHFTIDKKMHGPDHFFSADPNELSRLVKDIRQIEEMLGDGKKRCQMSELENKVGARRSIIASGSIKKGMQITNKMIAIKRPSRGIQPAHFNKVIGKVSRRNIKANEPIKWSDIK